MSDLSHTKLAFPPPPPTSNTLTAGQRNKLLRSTKKLGRVLGVTPHLLDGFHPLGPLHVQLDFRSQTHPADHRRRGSAFSCSSGTSGSTESASSNVVVSGHSSSLVHAVKKWHVNRMKKHPPLLRLRLSDSAAVQSTHDARPISPSFPPPSHSCIDDMPFTLRISRRESRTSLCEDTPAFFIPAESSLRRKKMERVRRKLGDGVPLDLVFPSEPEPQLPLTRPSPHILPRPLLTVYYGQMKSGQDSPDDRDSSEDHTGSIPGTGNGLFPIIGSSDEQAIRVSPCLPSSGCDRLKCKSPVVQEVDVDLDEKLRALVGYLGVRRRLGRGKA